jgi:hypothetical protein
MREQHFGEIDSARMQFEKRTDPADDYVRKGDGSDARLPIVLGVDGGSFKNSIKALVPILGTSQK